MLSAIVGFIAVRALRGSKVVPTMLVVSSVLACNTYSDTLLSRAHARSSGTHGDSLPLQTPTQADESSVVEELNEASVDGTQAASEGATGASATAPTSDTMTQGGTTVSAGDSEVPPADQSGTDGSDALPQDSTLVDLTQQDLAMGSGDAGTTVVDTTGQDPTVDTSGTEPIVHEVTPPDAGASTQGSWEFDADEEDWGFTWSHPDTLATSSSTSWLADVGYPDGGGALVLEMPFDAASQQLEVAVKLPSPYAVVETVSAYVYLQSGLRADGTGTAKISAKSGVDYVYAAGPPAYLPPGKWVKLTFDASLPDYVDSAGFDPTEIRELGIEFNSGAGSLAPTTAVVYVDSMNY